MLLPWLLFLLVCSCTGLPIPSSSQAGDISPGQVGGEAGLPQWPPSLPRVMSALPEEQAILEAPVVQEQSTSWDQQGANQALESYPGHQLQTSYPGQQHTSYPAGHQLQTYPGQPYLSLPGQVHSHQNYQHSHHGHQHRHRHGPHGGIQFDTQQQEQQNQYHQQHQQQQLQHQQQYNQHQQHQQHLQHQQHQQQWQQQQEETEIDADTRNQEVLLGLESGGVPSRLGEDEDGGEHRVYQRHLGYQTLHGFQANSPVRQGNHDGFWFKQESNNFAKSEDNVLQHDHRAHIVNGHQRYHGYQQQPQYSNMGSYHAQQTGHQALNSWSLPQQYQQQSSSYNAFLGGTNSRFPEAVSTQNPSTTTKATSVEEENDGDGLWSHGTSWISKLWPKAQQATVQE